MAEATDPHAEILPQLAQMHAHLRVPGAAGDPRLMENLEAMAEARPSAAY